MAVTERGTASLRVVGREVENRGLAAAASARPRAARSGPDRLTVILLSLGMFLGLLAVLADELRGSSSNAPRAVLVRRIYVTRVVETIPGPGPATSISQSVSSSGSAYPASSTPTTRSSGG